jgi:hypothetical protein
MASQGTVQQLQQQGAGSTANTGNRQTASVVRRFMNHHQAIRSVITACTQLCWSLEGNGATVVLLVQPTTS